MVILLRVICTCLNSSNTFYDHFISIAHTTEQKQQRISNCLVNWVLIHEQKGYFVNNFFSFAAVQHERAPRSCIPGAQLNINSLANAHLDVSAFSPRHIPLHHPHYQNRSGLLLPIPIHMPSAFPSSLDASASRHYTQFGAFHGNVFDTLHFGTSNSSALFPPPPPPPK